MSVTGASPVPRNERADVALVGFQDQGNLGMGYLAATLREHGRTVELLEFRDGPEALVDRIRELDPLVVGFSLIFQYYLPESRDLAVALRDAGVSSHFTIGGHYPSLCHDEVLEAMPELDSVVRFEGELTLADIVSRLTTGDDWREVAGLAYATDAGIVETEPRTLLRNLDELPWPDRLQPFEEVLGVTAAPVLASRGCARRCSFCSIHTFYRTAPGKVVRVRAPDKIVDELAHLHDAHNVRIFLFQDDDFPLWGKAGRRWVDALVTELHERELVGRAIWKISCRAEYVEPELFSMLRDAGLYLVYMGLESGTDTGLDVLNKQISVATNRAAIKTLKSIGVMFEYGFMLFDPTSTFESIRANIGFMREIVGDGSAAATFCRMLPYGGTPIRDQLAAEGRLRGDVVRPDYDFLDLRLNDYHRQLDAAAGSWIHGHGVSHQLNWAWNELEIVGRLVGELDGDATYRAGLADLTRRSNEALFALVEESTEDYERSGDSALLDEWANRVTCDAFVRELLEIRNDFVRTNQTELAEAILVRRELTGPVTQPQIF